MKSCSHRTLGQYLTNTYLQDYPKFCRHAFSIGCIQPDKNPTTYLKGSIHAQWLRGHNWDNAKKYIRKTGNHLQARKELRLLDFYRLGKLIHYTADAFTYSHNNNYTENLSAHRSYECDLHSKLEKYLSDQRDDFRIVLHPNGSVSDFISKNHKRYMHHIPCADNDMDYCVRMCAQVLQLMLQSKQLAPLRFAAFVKNRLAKSTSSCYSKLSLSIGGRIMGIQAAQFYFSYYYFYEQKK